MEEQKKIFILSFVLSIWGKFDGEFHLITKIRILYFLLAERSILFYFIFCGGGGGGG